MNTEEIGIISNPGCGMRDKPQPGLYFTVQSQAGGSLQTMFSPEAENWMRRNNVSDVKNLNGKAIIVYNHGGVNGTQTVGDLFK